MLWFSLIYCVSVIVPLLLVKILKKNSTLKLLFHYAILYVSSHKIDVELYFAHICPGWIQYYSPKKLILLKQQCVQRILLPTLLLVVRSFGSDVTDKLQNVWSWVNFFFKPKIFWTFKKSNFSALLNIFPILDFALVWSINKPKISISHQES